MWSWFRYAVVSAIGVRVMRVIIALLAFAFTTSVLHAQSVRVTGARVIAAGIYELTANTENGGTKDKSISTGQRYHIPVRLVRATTTIPLRDKAVFGATFDISGSPKGATAVLRVVWRYPSPGINGRLVDELSTTATIGHRDGSSQTWILGKASGLPIGVWTLELWDGSRLLATQQFTLVRPETQ
jgi:hypothetical protein